MNLTKERILSRAKNLADIIENEDWEPRSACDVAFIQKIVTHHVDEIVSLAGLVANMTPENARQAREILDGNCDLDAAVFDNDLIEVAGLTPHLVESLLNLYKEAV
jgi:hypothetical protein